MINAIYNHWFNALPESTTFPADRAYPMAYFLTGHDGLRNVRVMPNGRYIAKFKNPIDRVMFATSGTNGTLNLDLYGGEVTPPVIIAPGEEIFFIEGQTRYIPVRQQDQYLLMRLQHTQAGKIPEYQSAGLTLETMPTWMKAAGIATAVFLGWKILK